MTTMLEPTKQAAPWIVCQIGAREHYAVARALLKAGRLQYLVTDAWRPTGVTANMMPRRWQQRHHPDVPPGQVISFNLECLLFEAKHRIHRQHDWRVMMARNQWFMDRAAATLAESNLPPGTVVFVYSYSARAIFEMARARGWMTVLGQIDPGIVEERIIADLHAANPGIDPDWQPAPREYWENWRAECNLADRIVVNSEWSRAALLKERIDDARIRVVPLAYEKAGEGEYLTREYPAKFTPDRPLRVLFLGQITRRKGVIELLQAAEDMDGLPVEFHFVGPDDIRIPKGNNIRWHGSVTREDTKRHYRRADVFILPTHSDGFAMTQLEARAWKLPVIATRNCGDVVRHGDTGYLLDKVTPESIASVIRQCLDDPAALQRMSAHSDDLEQFDIDKLASGLLRTVETEDA